MTPHQTQFSETSPETNEATLVVLGTDVTLHEAMKTKAEADLGFKIEYRVLPEREAERVAAKEPNSFHLYDHFFHSLDLIWAADAIRPISLKKISNWDKVTSLSKLGSLSLGGRMGKGEAPVSRLYVQRDGSLGARTSDSVSMVPLVHNVDTFAYLPETFAPDSLQEESWAWIFDKSWHGKIALVANPALGLIETAMAAQSAGLIQFGDIGNISIREIDELMDLIDSRVKTGHFRSFWNTPEQAEDWFKSRKVALGSIWSPSVLALRGSGLKIRSAVPLEGYRAWHGGLAISSRISEGMLQKAYEYINWWLSGEPGAHITRAGHYISAPEMAKKYLSLAEWDYWYMGKQAQVDLVGIDGSVVVKKGELRDGGSYAERVNNIAIWNSTMSEHNYVVRRWNDIISRAKKQA